MIMFLSSCSLPTETEKKAFHFIASANRNDTIAPFGQMSLFFTEPLDTNVSLSISFQPSFYEYYIVPNAQNDTFSIAFTNWLQGNTKYGLQLATPVRSQSGHILHPSTDSVVFYTYPCEYEPNNSKITADSLNVKIFGSIAMVNDTDWYVVADSAIESFYLKSNGSITKFSIIDMEGTIYHSEMKNQNQNHYSLNVPSESKRPLVLRVYSINRTSAGYYELGIVN